MLEKVLFPDRVGCYDLFVVVAQVTIINRVTPTRSNTIQWRFTFAPKGDSNARRRDHASETRPIGRYSYVECIGRSLRPRLRALFQGGFQFSVCEVNGFGGTSLPQP